MAKTVWAKGVPLNEEAQTRLRDLIRERGENAVSEFLEIGRIAVARAAAGLGLKKGTLAVIRMKLAMLDQQSRAA